MYTNCNRNLGVFFNFVLLYTHKEENKMKKQTYTCPVYGYDGMKEPAYDKTGELLFEICSCCGFEFVF